MSDQGLPVEIDGGYGVDLFANQDRFTESDVIDLWAAEGVVAAEEAQRRVSEVLLIGTHEQHGLVGVSTAYLQRNDQLRAVLWHQRTFVAAAHRGSLVGVWFGVACRRHLDEQYVTGADRAALGILWEVENVGLQRTFPNAWWHVADFTFVGRNARGDHVRVHWFPGAPAPEPDA